jgi:hypothetical protein
MESVEDYLKRKGHSHPMPRPFTYENVKESLEEYAQLAVKEAREQDIKEMHDLKNFLLSRQLDPVKYTNQANGIEKVILIVKSKLAE